MTNIPATIKSRGQLADGTWRFIIDLQECPIEVVNYLHSVSGKLVNVSVEE